MRKIPLRTVEFTPIGHTEPAKVIYSDLMRTLLLTAPQGGGGIPTADGIRGSDISMVVKGAVAAGRDSVLLEEADHAFLLDRMNGFRWAFFGEEIADFCKSIRDAPVIDPNIVPEVPSG